MSFNLSPSSLPPQIITNSLNCLTTSDPSTAKLFYVPFQSDLEFRTTACKVSDRSQTAHSLALEKAMNGDYSLWEETWGLPKKWWERNKGADHIVVMAAPLTGLTHPSSKRGDWHYITTQHQLSAPIVISTELSTSFVKKFPKCAAKNIVVPYPNHNGDWFNGRLDQEVKEKASVSRSVNSSSLDSKISQMYYSGGMHGECVPLRKSIKSSFQCSSSSSLLSSVFGKSYSFNEGLRAATFCPCPHGDSPSAKRMYDTVIAGCIPVVLSTDFVWGLTTEMPGSSTGLGVCVVGGVVWWVGWRALPS